MTQVEFIKEERLDNYIKEAAHIADYEDSFGITGCDLSQNHWWAAYTRQSTREQSDNDRLGEYLLTLAKLTKQLGVIVPREYIIYDARSSEDLNRPGIDWLRRELIAKRRISGAAAPSQGRLSADPLHQLTLERECEYYCVQLVCGDSPTGNDWASQTARLIQAQANSLRIKSNRDNVLAGNIARVMTGKVPCHRAPHGYILVTDKVIDQRTGRVKVNSALWQIDKLDTSDFPELPEGWVWTRVGEIGHIVSGNTPKEIHNITSNGLIPYFKVGDMNKVGNERYIVNAEITLSSEDAKRLRLSIQNTGTVIFPKRGGAIATNKKRILAQPSAYDLNTMGITPMIITPLFLYYWMTSVDLAKLSDGSNVPQINHSDIEPLNFPFPTLDEQQKIVEEIERHLSVIETIDKSIEQSLKQAERLRQSILKRAFEGKLVPQDPSDEPAEKLLERIRMEKAKNQTNTKRRRAVNAK